MAALPASSRSEHVELPTSKPLKIRLPGKVLEMRGSAKTTVHQRRRKDSFESSGVVFEPLGPPPKDFSKEEVDAWNEVVDLSCRGVLTKNDRVVVECLSCLLVEARKKRWLISGAQSTRVERCLAFLGMTPAHRSHVKPAFRDEPPNPYG